MKVMFYGEVVIDSILSIECLKKVEDSWRTM